MRLTKYQKTVLRAQKRKSELSGGGVFVFRNNSSGDLFLPRPTKSGTTRVAVNEEFVGDDYYMFMVQSNELRLVRIIESPDVAEARPINESTEEPMADKLITEQPPVVTNEGTVEFVEQKPKKQQQKKLNEGPQVLQQLPDVLLNENPLEGIEII
jgi:hypothetical protein